MEYHSRPGADEVGADPDAERVFRPAAEEDGAVHESADDASDHHRDGKGDYAVNDRAPGADKLHKKSGEEAVSHHLGDEVEKHRHRRHSVYKTCEQRTESPADKAVQGPAD